MWFDRIIFRQQIKMRQNWAKKEEHYTGRKSKSKPYLVSKYWFIRRSKSLWYGGKPAGFLIKKKKTLFWQPAGRNCLNQFKFLVTISLGLMREFHAHKIFLNYHLILQWVFKRTSTWNLNWPVGPVNKLMKFLESAWSNF